MIDWLTAWHLTWGRLLWGLFFFVLSSVGGLVIAGLFVVNMPESYFLNHHLPRPGARGGLHGWAARICRNVAGALVILVGLVLSLPGVPGPGFLLILIGFMLMDFPGKHRIERWLVSRPGVLATMNNLRIRYGRPPMRLGSAGQEEDRNG